MRYIPAGKGKRGRPKRRWKRSAEKEMRKSNWTCTEEMGVIKKNKHELRDPGDSLCADQPTKTK